jgi:hypothetical protein
MAALSQAILTPGRNWNMVPPGFKRCFLIGPNVRFKYYRRMRCGILARSVKKCDRHLFQDIVCVCVCVCVCVYIYIYIYIYI